jgi:hypothetical protein
MEDHPNLAVEADLPDAWQRQSLFAPSVPKDARESRLGPVLSYGMGVESTAIIWNMV